MISLQICRQEKVSFVGIVNIPSFQATMEICYAYTKEAVILAKLLTPSKTSRGFVILNGLMK